MYRCYFIREGRIAAGQDIDVEILKDAIAYGYVLLREQPEAASFSGIELWQGKFLKYSDGYHYEGAGYAAPISSPIQADGVTMSLN
jgi:hypothetical protein